MTVKQTIISSFLFVLLSLNMTAQNVSSKKDILQKDIANPQKVAKKEKSVLNDRLKLFSVDDYPVTIDMLKGGYDKKRVGDVYSLDKAWFRNDDLNQSLLFELYTDYHRLYIFHFLNNDIPEKIIRQIDLSTTKSKFKNVFDIATYQQKLNSLSGFIKQAKKINASYFTTIKGFNLGDSKEKALKTYGRPDTTTNENEFEICEWNFHGEYNLTDENGKKVKVDLKGKPVAKDSFGYLIMMFFKDNKLKGQIISNDIP